MITDRKMGVLYDMTINVVTTDAVVDIQIRIVIGMFMSMVSTSFEKRFTILPIGVVSKNDIGARNIR